MFSFSLAPKQIQISQNANLTRKSIRKNSSMVKQSYQAIDRYVEIEGEKMTTGWQKIIEKNQYFISNSQSQAEYVPLPSKIDKYTQIEVRDWLLFDFDLEVIPILQILVARTVQQAKGELIFEKEKQKLTEKQRNLSLMKNAAIAETQRLLDRNLRIQKEKEIRSNQKRLFRMTCEMTQKKLLARQVVRFNLKSVFETQKFDVENNLEIEAFNKQISVEKLFHDNVFEKVRSYMDKKSQSQSLIFGFSKFLTDTFVNDHNEIIKKQIEKSFKEKNLIEKSKADLKLKIEQFNEQQISKHKLVKNRQEFLKIKKVINEQIKEVVNSDLLLIRPLIFEQMPVEKETKELYIGMMYDPILQIILILKKAFGNEFTKEIPEYFNALFQNQNVKIYIRVTNEIFEIISKINYENSSKVEELLIPDTDNLAELCADQFCESIYFPVNLISKEDIKQFYKVILENKLINEIENSQDLNLEKETKEYKEKNIKNKEFRQNLNKNFDFAVFSIEKNNIKTIPNNFLRLQEKLSLEIKEGVSENQLKEFQEKNRMNNLDGSIFEQKKLIYAKFFGETQLYGMQFSEKVPFVYNCAAQNVYICKLAFNLIEMQKITENECLVLTNELEGNFLEILKSQNSDLKILDFEF